MNISKLNELINSSKLNKVQIAERCGISRTTLDNVLTGSDAKISTIESLAKVLGVSVGYLFDEKQSSTINFADNADIKFYKEEIARLQSLLNNAKSTKVLVELEVDNDEFKDIYSKIRDGSRKGISRYSANTKRSRQGL